VIAEGAEGRRRRRCLMADLVAGLVVVALFVVLLVVVRGLERL
jgi:hypothetical protein